MHYENEKKKYYRFPSKTNSIDFEKYVPLYFPTQNLEQEIDDDSRNEIVEMKGDLL